MITRSQRVFNAADCADHTGKYAFGLNDSKTVTMLRQLADDIEAGNIALHSVSTSCHASHEEFTVRELVIEVLEEDQNAGPRVVKG
jgi:hypothetical protein